MWVFTASRRVSPRSSSSRLWILGTTPVRAGHHSAGLSRSCRRPRPGRGRAVDAAASCPSGPGVVHLEVARTPQRSRGCPPSSTGSSTGLFPDPVLCCARVRPQGCPQVVYEACLIVSTLARRALRVTPCYLRSRRGGIGADVSPQRPRTRIPPAETPQLGAPEARRTAYEARLRWVSVPARAMWRDARAPASRTPEPRRERAGVSRGRSA
jgi:hypothetical protein